MEKTILNVIVYHIAIHVINKIILNVLNVWNKSELTLIKKQFEKLGDKEISMFLKAIEHELKKGVSNEYRR